MHRDRSVHICMLGSMLANLSALLRRQTSSATLPQSAPANVEKIKCFRSATQATGIRGNIAHHPRIRSESMLDELRLYRSKGAQTS
eukprot:2667557-Pyramimonas_sp.AAC.1